MWSSCRGMCCCYAGDCPPESSVWLLIGGFGVKQMLQMEKEEEFDLFWLYTLWQIYWKSDASWLSLLVKTVFLLSCFSLAYRILSYCCWFRVLCHFAIKSQICLHSCYILPSSYSSSFVCFMVLDLWSAGSCFRVTFRWDRYWSNLVHKCVDFTCTADRSVRWNLMRHSGFPCCRVSNDQPHISDGTISYESVGPTACWKQLLSKDKW